MRQRDELPNPYASTLAEEGADERSVAFHYLLASAVTAGVVVGGALAAGGPASADPTGTPTAQEDTGGRHGDAGGVHDDGDNPPDSPQRHRPEPLMRLVANPARPVRSPADPVEAEDADEFVRGVAGALRQDRAGLEERIVAIRTAAQSPRPSPALHGAKGERTREKDVEEKSDVWARKQISRAEGTLDGLWLPASDGILDFAGSIAATAVQLDAPATRGIMQADPPDLVASPALVHPDGVRISQGRELLEWGADWVDRMAEDLVDTIDGMLDRIELRIVGRSVTGHPHPAGGRSPVLSVVASEPRGGSA